MNNRMRELSTIELSQIAGGGWVNDGIAQTPADPISKGFGNGGSPAGWGVDGSPAGWVNCGIFDGKGSLPAIVVPSITPGKGYP